ncbi:MAG TPA: hypothetical protein PKL61_14955, partial [Accumulibacter sp.]|uniref:hypothetical protein n=1 Tax=Accumulibacter sp. TaxID=2053492 RepID=UPI002C366ADA
RQIRFPGCAYLGFPLLRSPDQRSTAHSAMNAALRRPITRQPLSKSCRRCAARGNLARVTRPLLASSASATHRGTARTNRSDNRPGTRRLHLVNEEESERPCPRFDTVARASASDAA